MFEKIDKAFRKLKLIQMVEDHFDDEEMKNIVEELCYILKNEMNRQLLIEDVLYEFLSTKNIETDEASLINIANILIRIKEEDENGTNEVFNTITKINN